MEQRTCFFCGSTDILVPDVGLAGNDYSFCKKCLRGMTTEEFWRKLFKELGYTWPPELLK